MSLMQKLKDLIKLSDLCHFQLFASSIRVRTGHGKPGKSWNLSISVSRPGKLWNLIVGYGKAWKIIVCVVRKLLQVSISKDKIKYRQVMSEDTRKHGRFSKVAAKL